MLGQTSFPDQTPFDTMSPVLAETSEMKLLRLPDEDYSGN